MTEKTAYQRANEIVDALLGAQARAIWLAARVDGKDVREIAKEHGISVGQARTILAAADFNLSQADIVPPEPPKPPLKTNWAGFHQIGDE